MREGRCPDGLLGKMLARGMAQAEAVPSVPDISRMTAPNFFLIDLTQACNYSCKYCLRNPESEGRRMSTEMLDRILDRILELCETHHYTHISIQPWGGEPLLEFDKILHICELSGLDRPADGKFSLAPCTVPCPRVNGTGHGDFLVSPVYQFGNALYTQCEPASRLKNKLDGCGWLIVTPWPGKEEPCGF